MIALICKMCGAPMKTRRECEHCGTTYYTGPETPPPLPQYDLGYSGCSSSMVFSTNNGYFEPNGRYVSVGRMYGQ